jgi:acyl carrier protein
VLKYEDEVREIIHKFINQEEVKEIICVDTDLKTIGLNSIDFVKLVVEIEFKFDIEFPEEKFLFTEADSIGKICNIVEMCKDDFEQNSK